MSRSRRSKASYPSFFSILALAALIAPGRARAEERELVVLDAEGMANVIDALQPSGLWFPGWFVSSFGEDATGEPYGRVISVRRNPLGPTEDHHIYFYAVQIHRPDAEGARCVDELTIGTSDFVPFDFDMDGDAADEYAFAPERMRERIVPLVGIAPAHTLVPPSRVETGLDEVTVHFDPPICPETDENGLPITGYVGFAARRLPTEVGGTVLFGDDSTRDPVRLSAPVRPSFVQSPECVVSGLPLPFPEVTRFAPLCHCLVDDVFRENRCRFWLPNMELFRRIPWVVPPSSEFEVRWEVMPYDHGFEGLTLREALPDSIRTAEQGETYSIEIGAVAPGKTFSASQALVVGDAPMGVHTARVTLEGKGELVEIGNTYRVNSEEDLAGGDPPEACVPPGSKPEKSAGRDHASPAGSRFGCSSTAGAGGTIAFVSVLLVVLARARRRARAE